MRTRLALVLVAAFLGSSLPRLQAAGPFDNLLSQIPPEANVLVLIDAERIRASEFVKVQRLSSDDPEAAANHSFVPPKEILQAVMAAKIRGFRESLLDWQTALLNLKEEPSLTGFAASYQGTIEQLGKYEYVGMPNGAMALSPGKKVLAVLSPLDRKRATQAISLGIAPHPPKLSEFLAKAAASTGLKTDAVIALDLEDMFPQSRVLIYLQESETFKKPPVDALKAARMLQNLQGLTLKLKFTNEVKGEITVQFTQPVTDAGEWTKDLLLEVRRHD